MPVGQHSLSRISLNLVAPQALDADNLAALAISIHQDIDTQLSLEVHYFDHIQCTVSDKHRFVIGLA